MKFILRSGDIVKCIDPLENSKLVKDNEYMIKYGYIRNDGKQFVSIVDISSGTLYFSSRFELVPQLNNPDINVEFDKIIEGNERMLDLPKTNETV